MHNLNSEVCLFFMTRETRSVISVPMRLPAECYHGIFPFPLSNSMECCTLSECIAVSETKEIDLIICMNYVHEDFTLLTGTMTTCHEQTPLFKAGAILARESRKLKLKTGTPLCFRITKRCSLQSDVVALALYCFKTSTYRKDRKHRDL